MFVLFETSAGYAVFKLLKEKKLHDVENLYKDFETPEKASRILKLKDFKKFADTTEALAATTAAVEGKMSKTLKKLLKKLVVEDLQEDLLVADAKLGNSIKEKLALTCVTNTAVQELMRCIRSQAINLIDGLEQREMSAMSLGLAHSLSRYKLKFSPDKVDVMIIQAISLLDDLDKEINNYAMRAREWYGWHFPELGKIITDNMAYAKLVIRMGDRTNAATCDMSSILPEEAEQQVKEAAEISMGTEVSEGDIINITYLCQQVVELTDYRAQLYDYIKNRMMAIAPNLSVLVGELVGARLIAHAGSLINLAKHPASTVQILGAEKALFRALKTKHDTPKYGLIYHATIVGQTNTKNKGKISRMLAAKTALAVRVDALAENADCGLGAEHKAKLEARVKMLEMTGNRRISGQQKKFDKYENKSEVVTYNIKQDVKIKEEKLEDTPTAVNSEKKKKKKRASEVEDPGEAVGNSEKKKKIKRESEVEDPGEAVGNSEKKKKRKRESEVEDPGEADESSTKKKKRAKSDETPVQTPVAAGENSEKKKKKKKRQESDDAPQSPVLAEGSEKKKKKKKRQSEDPELNGD